MSQDPQELVEVAVEIARQAGGVLMSRLPLGRFAGTIERKAGRELVSEVDRASEALIVARLAEAFPEHTVLAEEGSGSGQRREGVVRWLVDPLDGTSNFLHGHPIFAVAMAAELDGELLAGVVHLPYLSETFFAARGKGAFLNSETIRLRVSDVDTMSEALVATGFAYDRERYDNSANLKRMLADVVGVRRCGSAATDLAYVAAGRYAAYWEMALRPWDVAAGALLVTEAGGQVTDFAGGDAFLEQGHVVAGNPTIAAQLRERLDPPPA